MFQTTATTDTSENDASSVAGTARIRDGRRREAPKSPIRNATRGIVSPAWTKPRSGINNRRLRGEKPVLFLLLNPARMATCPRCKGHLTEDHHCPRSPARRAFEIGIAAIGGAFCALLVIALIDPLGQLTVDAVLLVAGALVGVGLDRLLRK